MAAQTPMVLVGNKLQKLDPEDTLAGRVSILPITQTDYDAIAVPDVDVLYVIVDTAPSGAARQWEQLTQAEYDALGTPDAGTLYVVVG